MRFNYNINIPNEILAFINYNLYFNRLKLLGNFAYFKRKLLETYKITSILNLYVLINLFDFCIL